MGSIAAALGSHCACDVMSDDELFGLFQQFRPLGVGVDTAFAGGPAADEFVRRLLQVYAATSDGACAR
jgi:hypothetical protein